MVKRQNKRTKTNKGTKVKTVKSKTKTKKQEKAV